MYSLRPDYFAWIVEPLMEVVLRAAQEALGMEPSATDGDMVEESPRLVRDQPRSEL